MRLPGTHARMLTFVLTSLCKLFHSGATALVHAALRTSPTGRGWEFHSAATEEKSGLVDGGRDEEEGGFTNVIGGASPQFR